MISKETLLRLYCEEKLSVRKISLYLDIPETTVSYWTSKHAIPIRSKMEAAYFQHNKIFKVRKNLGLADQKLFALGIGLYWGEGNKASPYSVRLGNTDPDLILAFVSFLKRICGVDSADIKYGLQIFNDADAGTAKTFWMNKLQCSETSFHPTVSVIPPQGKGTYRRKNMVGVLQVYVNNKRLKEWLTQQIKDTYAAVAQR